MKPFLCAMAMQREVYSVLLLTEQLIEEEEQK